MQFWRTWSIYGRCVLISYINQRASFIWHHWILRLKDNLLFSYFFSQLDTVKLFKRYIFIIFNHIRDFLQIPLIKYGIELITDSKSISQTWNSFLLCLKLIRFNHPLLINNVVYNWTILYIMSNTITRLTFSFRVSLMSN